jgi:hypothetical protein
MKWGERGTCVVDAGAVCLMDGGFEGECVSVYQWLMDTCKTQLDLNVHGQVQRGLFNISLS